MNQDIKETKLEQDLKRLAKIEEILKIIGEDKGEDKKEARKIIKILIASYDITPRYFFVDN